METNYNFSPLEGEVLLIDKPKEWTSFDVVNKVRHTFGIARKKFKVGHAGTLDPLATGLLIVCTGKKTKTIDQIQGLTKSYLCDLVIGKTTPSFDLETEFDSESNISHLEVSDVTAVIESFIGEQQQVPPMYSAIRVDGERLYKKARKGEVVEVKSRRVVLHEIEIKEINLPKITIDIKCSKGTYIRSLVRDIGEKLSVGAYMSDLRRTAIGEYQVGKAYSIAEIVDVCAKWKEENIEMLKEKFKGKIRV